MTTISFLRSSLSPLERFGSRPPVHVCSRRVMRRLEWPSHALKKVSRHCSSCIQSSIRIIKVFSPATDPTWCTRPSKAVNFFRKASLPRKALDNGTDSPMIRALKESLLDKWALNTKTHLRNTCFIMRGEDIHTLIDNDMCARKVFHGVVKQSCWNCVNNLTRDLRACSRNFVCY